MNALLTRWNNYWFKPGSLFNLAVVRVLVIAYHIYWIFTRFPPKFEALHQLPELYNPMPLFEIFTLFNGPPSEATTTLVMAIAGITGVLALLGIMTRVSIWGFALSSLYLNLFLYSFRNYNHPEGLLIITLFILAFSPIGAVFSVDHLLRRRVRDRAKQEPLWDEILNARSPLASWPLLLVQWLFVLVYLSAGLNKIFSGETLFQWADGYTLQYYLVKDSFEKNVPLALELVPYFGMIVAMSWTTLIFEMTFVLAVVSKRLRWLYLLVGTGFHAAIFIIQRATFFSFIVLYSVFIPWDKLARWVRNLFRIEYEYVQTA